MAVAISCVVITWPASSSASGNETPGERSPRQESEFYDGVDDATVRVFAVGAVDVETFNHEGLELRVAMPSSGHGTGFAVSDDGLILTANHVIEGARHVVVRLPGEGGIFPARVVYASEDPDVALLQIAAQLPAFHVAPDAPLRVRQTVYAVGYPIDASRVHPQSARGIVSGRVDDDTIQLDMALNPGNSGGPVVDERGRVIGMAVAGGDVTLGVQGIGYAVSARALEEAIAEGRARLEKGSVLPFEERAEVSAAVVDELVQKGALYELRELADVKERLESADLEEALQQLISRTEDSDLLAFISGVLWNAYLAVEVLGYRQLGDVELSEGEARQLARRLLRTSGEAARRAHEVDPEVVERSPFVSVALSGRRPSERASAGSGWMHARLVIGRADRIRRDLADLHPSVITFGLAYTLDALAYRRDERLRVVPILGAVVGLGSRLAGGEGGSSSTSLAAGEVGAVLQYGRPRHHLEVIAALGPVRTNALYRGSERPVERGTTLLQARLNVGYRFYRLTVGVGARVVHRSTIWLEPFYLGYVYPY